MFTAFFVTSALGTLALRAVAPAAAGSRQPFASASQEAAFGQFRQNYLLVFWLANGCDWLYGAYLYSVYKQHGLDIVTISRLGVVGFLSSASLGTVVGSVSDQVGRKRMALAFSACFIASCCCIASSSIAILTLGRVFGGVSTSLLFSVFEAWMLSEHKARDFPPPTLGGIFSTAYFGNSVVAIGTGLLAEWVAEYTHNSVSPFMLAIVPATTCAVVVSKTWNENFGSAPKEVRFLSSELQHFEPDDKRRILAVGAMQATFESAMYGFVFLFALVLDASVSDSYALPFGTIFATFMVWFMLGTTINSWIDSWSLKQERAMAVVAGLAAAALFCAALAETTTTLLICFSTYEACVGVYFPMMSKLRSRYIPESIRATAVNVFRAPMNVIVCGLMLGVSLYSSAALLLFCATLACLCSASACIMLVV
ncbi:hypothetical protein RI367_000020 [Sorochytrium milnesiophthora]